MREYFKLTAKKVLGVIIMLFLFSMVGIIPYVSAPEKFVTGEYNIVLGWPMPYATIKGGALSDLNILNIIIDIVIFYLVMCLLDYIFKGGKKKERSFRRATKNQDRCISKA